MFFCPESRYPKRLFTLSWSRLFFRKWQILVFVEHFVEIIKLCCDCHFQGVITACSWVFKFEITTCKHKSVATVFHFLSVKIQVSLVSLWVKWTISILLKYTNVEINASSKLKTLSFEFSIETFLSAENSTVWVFKLGNHTSMIKTHA